jgi:hypothetical protein
VRDQHYQGQERWPTSPCPSRIASIEIFTQEKFLVKKTVRQVLVGLPHSRGLGGLCNEEPVGKIGASNEEQMNSLLSQQCSWLLSFFYHASGPVIRG